MSVLVDVILARRKKQEKYFKDYLYWAKKIKQITEALLNDRNIKIIIFGSVLKKDEVARDIDVLVISSALKDKNSFQKSEIRANIWEKIGFESPFEIHLIAPEDYENWYKFFIGDFIEI
jgi:predicted nucleotidyltransferase